MAFIHAVLPGYDIFLRSGNSILPLAVDRHLLARDGVGDGTPDDGDSSIAIGIRHDDEASPPRIEDLVRHGIEAASASPRRVDAEKPSATGIGCPVFSGEGLGQGGVRGGVDQKGRGGQLSITRMERRNPSFDP